MIRSQQRCTALALLAGLLLSSCSNLPPLQLRSESYRIYAAERDQAEILAADFLEYDPQVQAHLVIEAQHQHQLIVVPTPLTSRRSHGGTSESGQMQFGYAALSLPGDSIVPHELVHAHFRRSGLPSLPKFLEEGVAYRVGDLVLQRDITNRLEDHRRDYSILELDHLDLGPVPFIERERAIRLQGTLLGYEIVYRLGIPEVLRLGREGATAIDFIECANLAIGDGAPPLGREVPRHAEDS